jgi:predicted aldo/keto reductase-like oxidoreductase
MPRDRHRADLDRRRFLVQGTAATLGLGLAGLPRPGWSAPADPQIRAYRTLGRTGLQIADISFGSSRSHDPDLPRYAFERGINYFDTAETYQDGRSEEAIGEGLQGIREQVILVSKVKCEADTSRQELMKRLEGSLRRLRTDRIEVYFNHAVNDLDRLKNEEWLEFTELAKKQGKIRFTGVSGHGGNLVECMDYTLDHDLADVILCAYNFGQDPSFFQRFTSRLDFIAVQPDLPRVLEKAHGKGVGLVAMKTLRGARLNQISADEQTGATFAQLAFRWVLANPHMSGLVISMKSREQIDEFVGASGAPPPRGAELDRLEDYLLSSRDGYCNHGCDLCEASCPRGVPVSEVLRTRMYAVDYGDLEYGRAEYARLAANASACSSCTTQDCRNQCPHGLEIARLTRSAHHMLA